MKKIYLTLLSCCLTFCGFSQSVIFTPNNSGGFENGPSFAANTWTAVNGPANQWAVGTGSVNVGTRGAYIGNGTTFVGTNTPAINHFYRTGGSAIPAGAFDVFLSFRYRQPVVDPGNDSFIVSVTSTAVPTPAAGATVNFLHNRLYQNTATAYPGYVEVPPIDLTALAGTTVRLVFTHVNNGAGPIGIPAVDSISLTYCNPITGTATMCEGAGTNLACLTPGGTWSSSNALIATVGATAGTTSTITGVAAGTATITHIAGTCTATRVVTVNVTPTPLAGTLSVCSGNTTTLTTSPVGGAWTSSAAGTASVTGGVVTGGVPGTANISYSMPTGCRAVAQVTVNTLPGLFNVTGGGSYCAAGSGVPVGLSGSAVGINYDLSDGTSTVGTLSGTGSALNYGLFTTAGTYTVLATNPVTTCTRNMTGSAVITVAPPVVPSVSISGTLSIICDGATETFTAIPVNEGPTPSYQWFVNGIAVGTGTTYSYAPVSGDVVSVTMTPGGICAVPDFATASQTIVVTPLSTPAVTISVNPGTTCCLGSPVTFTATPAFGGTPPSFRWTRNGINVATGPGYTCTPANGDVVYCMMTSNYACRTIDTALSSNITITAQASAPLPVVNIAAFPSTNITPGTSVTLTAIVTGGTGAVSYQWLVNGVAIPGATNNTTTSNTYINGDIVTCIVTNMDACAKFALKSVGITNGGAAGVIQSTAPFAPITISPNPNSGSFTLHGSIPANGGVNIKIVNMLGQVVYTKRVHSGVGMLDEQVSLTLMPAGMYMLNIISEHNDLLSERFNHSMHFVISN